MGWFSACSSLSPRPGDRIELLDWARRWLGSCRLTCDVPEKVLIFPVVDKRVIAAASHLLRDVLILSAFEQNGNELRAVGVVIIDLLVRKQAFPFDSLSCPFPDLVSGFGQIVLGADDHDVVCGVDLLFHPARPVGGRRIHKAVQAY